jgi:hypothetical protein
MLSHTVILCVNKSSVVNDYCKTLNQLLDLKLNNVVSLILHWDHE